MELTDIVAVNDLFAPIYPYVARQVAVAFGRKEGEVLEMGPFAGGVSIELARQHPGLSLTMGDDFPGLLPSFQGIVAREGLVDRIAVRAIDKSHLPFGDACFDLVVFRGALFFWEDSAQIVREMYRVLRPGALAMAGGGFGAETPEPVIESVARQSRDLNRRLGKRVLSETELLALLRDLGLDVHASIERRHGLWAEIRKQGE
ncbi:MAG: class I SAM-dependent methyltransferase [Dehalococcoidia bacterium]|nr:class I SAM-dependent methyltransferase [Dehalococcoidia bacterium]